MNIYLDDSKCREALFPFALTRHVADIRIGILTIREKWGMLTGLDITTEPGSMDSASLVISANVIPTQSNIEFLIKAAAEKTAVIAMDGIKVIHHPWQIFQFNDWAIREDFKLLVTGRESAEASTSNELINSEDIFIEPGAKIEHSTLNASTGPIYIGTGAEIMEGSLVRGPFALCNNAVLKMGAKIYGGTTIGPFCIAAGEIKNSVMFGFSNKAHDGYLGDSVIGEWCNLGAGTSNSNLKNTAGAINYFLNNNTEAVSAGNKGGLLMADFSRAAINTSFNTGTVVGVCCNIFNDVSARKYIPDFSWGNDRYIFEKALQDIAAWKQMKNQLLTEKEIELLQKIYDR